jgi:hypothetical protein
MTSLVTSPCRSQNCGFLTNPAITGDCEDYEPSLLAEGQEPEFRQNVIYASWRCGDLDDVGEPALVIVCEPCGRYNVKRLIAAHGDAKLTDLLTTLADCPKGARSASMIDARRCTKSFRCGLKSVSAR